MISILMTAILLSQIPEKSGTIINGPRLQWMEISEGSGPRAGPGQKYTVHYTGWLNDGTKFDSSRDRNEPFQFVQGRRQVIAGWEMGFEGMRVGGKRRLFIPPSMAYGEKGTGPIPPKADLTFDVELLQVEEAEQLIPAEEVLSPLKDLRQKVLALAEIFPEEKLDWRPQEGVHSVREVLLHIAYGNRLMLGLASKPLEAKELSEKVTAQWEQEKQPLPKDKVLAELKDSFAAVESAMQGERAGTLMSNITFFGRQTTRRGVLIELDNHVSEHLGQLIAYARMNGIKPPWSGK